MSSATLVTACLRKTDCWLKVTVGHGSEPRDFDVLRWKNILLVFERVREKERAGVS